MLTIPVGDLEIGNVTTARQTGTHKCVHHTRYVCVLHTRMCVHAHFHFVTHVCTYTCSSKLHTYHKHTTHFNRGKPAIPSLGTGILFAFFEHRIQGSEKPFILLCMSLCMRSAEKDHR